jgi:hypothetical protein
MKHLKLTFVGLLALHAPNHRNSSAIEDRPIGAKSSIQHAMMAAILLVAGTSSAAFGDEPSAGVTVLRGTPPRVEQPQKPQPQPLQLAPPPLPSCPEGYSYSLLGGYCYRLRDPLNG